MTDIETALRTALNALCDLDMPTDRCESYMCEHWKEEATQILAVVVQGMVAEQAAEITILRRYNASLAEQAREIEQLHTATYRYQQDRIEWDQQYERLTREIEGLKHTLTLWDRECAGESPRTIIAERQRQTQFHTLWKAKAQDAHEEIERLRGLYADVVNQFAHYFTKDGIEMVSTGGLSDLETAFTFFSLPDPCKLGEFHAALRATPEAGG